MNCHKLIWLDSPTLEPVRASWRTDEPIVWNKVYDLPNFVYFNHSIHVSQGIGCSTCHGRVDQMNLIYQVPSLQMSWCLSCHRQPEAFIRPRDQVFNMAYEPPADQLALGRSSSSSTTSTRSNSSTAPCVIGRGRHATADAHRADGPTVFAVGQLAECGVRRPTGVGIQ